MSLLRMKMKVYKCLVKEYKGFYLEFFCGAGVLDKNLKSFSTCVEVQSLNIQLVVS